MSSHRFQPRAVVEVDLADPGSMDQNLAPYERAHVLVRLFGTPICAVDVSLTSHKLDRLVVGRAITRDHGSAFSSQLARLAVQTRDLSAGPDVRRLFEPPLRSYASDALPLVTVAVCTRDRAQDLTGCLDALLQLDYPNLDLLVVDNAPSTPATEELVRRRYPHVRYVCELRPGLDWARNRAIVEARGDILAFTDDDVIVDRGWVAAVVRVFQQDPDVMAITGLVVAHELDTPAQHLFEAYGGFGRGFRRRWFRARGGRPVALDIGGTGAFGTGANMAYRREVFDRLGGFDPALDVGTCTNGGGDLEMFFRVLKEGHMLVYEPAAIVRHRHRRGHVQLRAQIANNGIGFYSYLARTARLYRDERNAILRLGLWWFRWWNLRRLVRASLRREAIPLGLVLVELFGSLRGPFRYWRSARRAAALEAAHPGGPAGPRDPGPPRPRLEREAVRQVDLARPLERLTELAGYRRVHVYVFWRGIPLGRVALENDGRDVSALQLEDAIADRLSREVLDVHTRIGEERFWKAFARRVDAALRDGAEPLPVVDREQFPLPDRVAVSVVVATRDRPDDLRACLTSLVSQRTCRRLEIVVVDNNPASAVTRDVVGEFPGVVLVVEPRAGLSYARNRGILAATGEIIATTDDDVVCPDGWIEALVRPFRDERVMVVTGNVLPIELETRAQQLFEAYGGLGRGFRPWIAGAQWFRARRRAVPTWELGCTANAAFRASIFSNPKIGLMDEALGAGTPTGCSEDTYVFYRVLHAGHVIAYEPRAYVWHRHRRTLEAFRQQLYSYSKGHVAYHLCTLFREGDVRALIRLAYELPEVLAVRALRRLRRRSDYPLAYLMIELRGYLAGPCALWRSRRRARRLGPSARPETRPAVETPRLA